MSDPSLNCLCRSINSLTEGQANGDVVVATSLALERCFYPSTGIGNVGTAYAMLDAVVDLMKADIRKAFDGYPQS